MKPAPFKLARPESVAEVCAALVEYGDDARVIAGGQSLIPSMNFRLSQPSVLVDLDRVADLDFVTRRDEYVSIGAMTRQSAAARAELLRRDAELIAKAIPFIGHVQNRNRGTVGGSIAHADPAAELPAVAIALDARLRLTGADHEREVPARQFFQGPFTTAIEHGELLTEILLPARSQARSSLQELARRHGDFAIAGVAMSLEFDAGVVTAAGIAAFGVTSTAIRLSNVEQAIIGQSLDVAVIKGAAVVAREEPQRVTGDIHASGAYRRELLGTLASRALGDIARQEE